MSLPADVQVSNPGESASPKVKEFMSALSGFAKAKNPYSEDTWLVLQPLFEANIESDSEAYAQVLDNFRRDPTSVEGDLFAILIGKSKIHDPRAMKVAFDLAKSDSKKIRLTGLDLINRMGINSKEQEELVLQVLEQESDPDLLRESFFALNGNVETEDLALRERFQRVAVKHTGSPNHQVHGEALKLLSQLSNDEVSFGIIAESLDHKSEVVVAEALKALSVHAQHMDSNLVGKILEVSEKFPQKYMLGIAKDTLSKVTLSKQQKDRLNKIQENLSR